jgi:signal transduction histidine kinase
MVFRIKATHDCRLMNNTLRLHLVSMAMYVAVIGCMFWSIRPATHTAAWWAVLALQAVFLGCWAGLIARWSGQKGGAFPRHQVDFSLGLTVQWLGHVAVIPALAVLLPGASEAVRLMVIICLMGPILTAILGTFEGPDDKGYHEALPLVMPTAIALIFVGIGGRFMVAVVLSMAGLILLSLLLRAGVKRMFERVRRAKRDAESERDAKSRFLASASHDLGQPLQSARLFFDQVVRGADPARRAKAAGQAEAAFAAIERQLHKIIEHLKLDSGDVTPRSTNVFVGPLIARLASLAEAQAAQAGVAIHALPSRLVVQADADLLERALSNLIDNAVHHSKGRRVLIGARSSGDIVRLWVIDDGRGVATPDHARLFDDYAQGSDHGEEVRGGFGLGLASVRRIMALLRGRCGLEPRWRGGAAFFLELPRTLRHT